MPPASDSLPPMRVNNENKRGWGFDVGSCEGFFGGFCYGGDNLSDLDWAPSRLSCFSFWKICLPLSLARAPFASLGVPSDDVSAGFFFFPAISESSWPVVPSIDFLFPPVAVRGGFSSAFASLLFRWSYRLSRWLPSSFVRSSRFGVGA